MSIRDEIVAKISAAIEGSLLQMGTCLLVDHAEHTASVTQLDTWALAEAAFDAVADEWAPPF